MRTRKIQIPLRLNEKEFKHLQKQVEKSCLNREKYLRALILGHRVHPQPCEEYIEVLKILSSSMNRIDEITRIVSKTGHASENDICFLRLMTQKLWEKFQEMD